MTITGRLCSNSAFATVHLEGERISAIDMLDSCESPESDLWISSGWIDLQVNGYGGHNFNCASRMQESPVGDEPRRIAESLWKSGTAMACPTIVTASREDILAQLGSLNHALENDAVLARALPAIHLEGPYISGEEGLRGAHALEHTRDPEWDEFVEFQEACNGRIKIVTIAPERAGSLEFIQRATASGVTVSLGHTGANSSQIQDAVEAGARMSTHLGNGSQDMIQRHSNYFFEQLANDDLTACIITDGHHLPPQLSKIITRVKDEKRLVLVSDAVAWAGMPAGVYDNGRREVLDSGKVVLAGTPYLAGAGHLLDHCIAEALSHKILNMRTMELACATNPARLLNRPSSGAIAVGNDADLTVFRVMKNGDLQTETTVLRGEVVYKHDFRYR